MWQDAAVTLIALGAVGALAWRWHKSRSRPAGACPSCASGNPCEPAEKPAAVTEFMPAGVPKK